MKRLILILMLLPALVSGWAQTIENGVVREYRGKAEKTPLGGVELQVKGAPSTVSGAGGQFSLRFSTLVPGDKVCYTDIYKEGYVIFNKDALDAWRISNNGRTFTVVMCRESDFRALKKKFYGIIEKSYLAEYNKLKAEAEKLATNAENLKSRLKKIEDEYNEKMGNINTYVELFSRIDCSEMDEVEARALENMENGNIAEAIRIYEELQLERQMDSQLSKWDAADEMRRAADGMESQAQADLIILVGKMQKQLTLYTMGGRTYDAKRIALTDRLIPMLTRLNPVTENRYNEDLGLLLTQRAAAMPWAEREPLYRQAAALPSVAGLTKLASRMAFLSPSVERNDTIRSLYTQALSLCSPEDSTAQVIKGNIRLLPDGIYKAADGRQYPWRRLDNGEAELCTFSPRYSTHLEGEVRLPDFVEDNGTRLTVTKIGENAFRNNPRLLKVTLPRHCRMVAPRAFLEDGSLRSITLYGNVDSVDWSGNIPFEYAEPPRHIEWIENRYNDFMKYNEVYKDVIESLIHGLALYYIENGDKMQVAEAHCQMSHIAMQRGDYRTALAEVRKGTAKNYPRAYNLMAYLYASDEPSVHNYKKAMQAVEMAISLATDSTERANYVDSRGELRLRQGDEEGARRDLDEALALDSNYAYNTNSALYSHFNPVNPELQKADSIAQAEKLEKRRNRNMAIALMALDYLTPQLTMLDSLQIFKLQFRYLHYAYNLNENDDLFNSSINNVFVHFVHIICEDLWNDATLKGKIDNETFGMLCPFRNDYPQRFYMLSMKFFIVWHNKLPKMFLDRSDVESVTLAYETLKRFVKTLDDTQKTLFITMLEGHDMPYLTERFKVSEDSITNFVDKAWNWVIKEFSQQKVPENLTDNETISERYDKVITYMRNDEHKREKILENMVDIAQIISRHELHRIKERANFIGLEYEEMLSICIITAQVLLKNKTVEQLNKYTPMYISSAMRWALSNEMSIRYDWYNENFSAYDLRGNVAIDNKIKSAGLAPDRLSVMLQICETLRLISLVSTKNR